MQAGIYYHIFNRGINKQNIFFEEANYIYFLQQFKKYAAPFVDVFAYCLMPNYFHFFIRVKDDAMNTSAPGKLTTTEKAMKDFFISYSKSINKKYGRTGALFQYKFKRKEITNDGYYTWLIYYIHCNPLKAGLCLHFEHWKYSSYNAIISSKETLLKRDELLEWFGGIDSFISFHKSNLADEKRYKEFEQRLGLP